MDYKVFKHKVVIAAYSLYAMGIERALPTSYNVFEGTVDSTYSSRYDCDVLLLSSRDVSPSIMARGRELPLISPAFEGLRYLANSKQDAEQFAHDIMSRRSQELFGLHLHGVSLVLSPIQPEILSAYFREFEEDIQDNEDIMKGYERASGAFRSLLARVSAARRHLPTQQYRTMESSLEELVDAYRQRNVLEAERVTSEDISLLAAAYDLSQIKDYDLDRLPNVKLINGSLGARWLYDTEIWTRVLPRRPSFYLLHSRTPPENLSFTHSEAEVFTDAAVAA